jgi:hypothetical protein
VNKKELNWLLTCTAIKHNLKISITETNALAMKANMTVIAKAMIKNHVIEQVYSFNYLGSTIAVTNDRDLEIRMNKFKKEVQHNKNIEKQDEKRYTDETA